MSESLPATPPTSATGMPGEGQAPAAEPGGDGINMEALAEKVYRLLKDEARLERERLGRRPLG